MTPCFDGIFCQHKSFEESYEKVNKVDVLLLTNFEKFQGDRVGFTSLIDSAFCMNNAKNS